MAQNINVKLYIEGCEIPFTDISISAAINRPSTCTINIVPSEFVKRLTPRSHILVLFQEGQSWKVLWDGEYRGWGMAKSASSISMQIMAADYSNALSFMTRAVFENFGDVITTPTVAILQTGSPLTIQPAGSGTFANLINSLIKTVPQGDFGSLMTALINTFWNNTPYFADANKRNKTVPRFVSLPDSYLNTILTNTIANDFMQNIITNRFNGNVTIESVLQYFMDVAQYIRVPVIGPTNYLGTPMMALFKPKNHFSTPPVFNCFFPGMFSSVSGYGVDYFTEPTRILMSTENIPLNPKNGGFKSVFFFNDSRSGFALNTNVGNAALIKDGLSQQELDSGILPVIMDLNYERASQTLVGSKDTNFATLQKTYQAYAFYQFVEAKYSLRQCSVHGIFHPYCMVGFPGAIFDPHQSLFGMVESITHLLSAEGSASTTINFSHVYPADRNDPNSLTYPPLPSFMARGYRPEGSDANYTALFGTNVIDDKNKHAAMGGPNISSAKRFIQSYSLANNEQYNIADIANIVYPVPSNSTDNQTVPLYTQNIANPGSFESKYSYRNIMTAKDYLAYLNINAGLTSDTQEPPPNFPASSLIYQCPTGYTLNKDLSYTITAQDTHRYDNALALQNDLNSSAGKDGR